MLAYDEWFRSTRYCLVAKTVMIMTAISRSAMANTLVTGSNNEEHGISHVNVAQYLYQHGFVPC